MYAHTNRRLYPFIPYISLFCGSVIFPNLFTDATKNGQFSILFNSVFQREPTRNEIFKCVCAF